MAKGGKSVEVQIEEKEEEIRKLKEEQERLRLAQQPQYPKHIQVPAEEPKPFTPTTTVVVNSEEEEKAALSGKLKGAALPESADQKLRIDEMRAKEADDKKYKGPGEEEVVVRVKAPQVHPRGKRATRSKK